MIELRKHTSMVLTATITRSDIRAAMMKMDELNIPNRRRLRVQSADALYELLGTHPLLREGGRPIAIEGCRTVYDDALRPDQCIIDLDPVECGR